MRELTSSSSLVTIAIPTYNRAEAFLPQAIRSAVNQTYQDLEILVSDNCSDDDTEMVVGNFSDDRIKYHRQKENIGFLENVNFCLDKARGEYIVLLFDDDLIDHDFVECCMSATKGQSNVGLILTGTRVIDGKGVVKSVATNKGSGVSFEDFCLGWFAHKFPLYLCSTMFLTRGLREMGGVRSKTHAFLDVVAEVKMISKFNRVDVYDAKASFRRHENNMGTSGGKVYDWREDSCYLLELMCGLSSQKRGEVEAKGLKYFCEKNYRVASNISSLFHRARAYWETYKRFRYSSSLLLFLYEKNVASSKRLIRRIFPQS